MPTLVLAEAYMHDEIEIEGSIQELVASAYRKADSFLTNQSGFGKSIVELLGNHPKSNRKRISISTMTLGTTFTENGWIQR